MLDFILNPRYRNPTELATFQDKILNLPGIDVSKVEDYLKELEKYDILFKSFFGLNAIPENNLAIRNNLIKSVLYFIKKDHEKAKEFKLRADEIFTKLKIGWFFVEGWSYLLYIKNAYMFYFKFIPEYKFGNVSTSTLTTMEEYYKKISCLDGSVPTTDTSFTHKLQPEPIRATFHNDFYSNHIINNQDTQIFIDHNRRLYDFRNNMHVNYTFGHFTIFHNGKHLIRGRGYPGYDMKQKTKIKESWNNNIIYGDHCKEPYWRYLPKKSLEWTYKDGIHNFKIGKDITRKIEILNSCVVITDNGGEYSSFNLTEDCKYEYFGKGSENIGFHSPDYGKVEEHRRLKISGKNRIFSINF